MYATNIKARIFIAVVLCYVIKYSDNAANFVRFIN